MKGWRVRTRRYNPTNQAHEAICVASHVVGSCIALVALIPKSGRYALFLKLQKHVRFACFSDPQHAAVGFGGVAVPVATAGLHSISSLLVTPQMLPSSSALALAAATAAALTMTRARIRSAFEASISTNSNCFRFFGGEGLSIVWFVWGLNRGLFGATWTVGAGGFPKTVHGIGGFILEIKVTRWWDLPFYVLIILFWNKY